METGREPQAIKLTKSHPKDKAIAPRKENDRPVTNPQTVNRYQQC